MAASANTPQLGSPIVVDIPAMQEILASLIKMDPTNITDLAVGAKRFIELSNDNWQLQIWNGSQWVVAAKLKMDTDTLDGYDASITPKANTVAVRGADGKLQDSITGNAATADIAGTLSLTLDVNKGGTGATTSAQARENLGAAPKSHANSNTTYGLGSATAYGHLKLSDATNSTSTVTSGVAATPNAVKLAYDRGTEGINAAAAAMEKASTLATANSPGIVKPGSGMIVDPNGALSHVSSSTTQPGIVQLNDAIDSTSTTTAATANAVKKVNESANAAMATANAALPKSGGTMTGAINMSSQNITGVNHVVFSNGAELWVE